MRGLGDKIKSIRLNLGETMEEFGARFDTSKGTINNWEKERNKPNKANLKAIAQTGGTTVDELLYGSLDIKIPVDDYLLKNLKEDIDNKDKVHELSRELITKCRLKRASSTVDLDKDLSDKTEESYKKHQERIDILEKFAKDYIKSNYDDYTYDKYLEGHPDSDLHSFQRYKEKEWDILKQLLDKFWEAFDVPDQVDDWISKHFTDQIRDELHEISKIAVEEEKEHYYINEVVQPFLDQTAEQFKEYIKDYIDAEK